MGKVRYYGTVSIQLEVEVDQTVYSETTRDPKTWASGRAEAEFERIGKELFRSVMGRDPKKYELSETDGGLVEARDAGYSNPPVQELTDFLVDNGFELQKRSASEQKFEKIDKINNNLKLVTVFTGAFTHKDVNYGEGLAGSWSYTRVGKPSAKYNVTGIGLKALRDKLEKLK